MKGRWGDRIVTTLWFMLKLLRLPSPSDFSCFLPAQC
jgi:hypothetical protein